MKRAIVHIILLSIFIFSSCSEKLDHIDIKNESVLDGLYRVTYLNLEYSETTDMVWIFANNIKYVLYTSHSKYSKGMTYETPTYFYIKDNKLFDCWVEVDSKPVSIEKCKKSKNNPGFDIVKFDTISDNSSKKQSILLEGKGLKVLLEKSIK